MSSILKLIIHPAALVAVLAVPILVVVYHLAVFILDRNGLRSIPGPLLAKLTHAWYGSRAYKGISCEAVYDLHKHYGTFVRITPDHVSIASPAAIPLIYGHSAGLMKGPFYDAFVSFGRAAIFSTRSRTDHSRKRRIISHTFAPRSIRAFEARVSIHIGQLVARWDEMCAKVSKDQVDKLGSVEFRTHDGRVWFNCMTWINFFTFDVIGELAFGAPFGMLVSGKDAAQVPKSREAGLAALEKRTSSHVYETETIPAIATIHGRGDLLAFLGTLPGTWRPFVKALPMFKKSGEAAVKFPNMALAAIARKVEEISSQKGADGPDEEWDEESKTNGDMLAKLLQGKDENGEPMGAMELCAEALTLLVAGSDTTSNSASAIVWYVARDQRVQVKLRAELDEALGSSTSLVADMSLVEHLPYLEAVVNEGLRLFSTLGIGLERVVPEGGMEILGQHFKEGTLVSVPAFVVHRDTSIWGNDVEEFRPERWFEGDTDAMQKAFIPFSVGPRACIGRSLAKVELLKVIATIFRRYDIILEDPHKPLELFDALVRRPLECRVGLALRDSGRKDAIAY